MFGDQPLPDAGCTPQEELQRLRERAAAGEADAESARAQAAAAAEAQAEAEALRAALAGRDQALAAAQAEQQRLQVAPAWALALKRGLESRATCHQALLQQARLFEGASAECACWHDAANSCVAAAVAKPCVVQDRRKERGSAAGRAGGP